MYVQRHAASGRSWRGSVRWGLGAGLALLTSLIVAWRWVRARLAHSRAQGQTSAERLAELIEGLDAVVWQLDPHTGRFSFLNQQSETLLGYPRYHWLEQGLDFFFSIVHPEDRERIATTTWQCLEHMHDCDITYRAVAHDGRIVWMRSLVRPTPSGDHLCGVSIDVTEQHRAEEALIASDHRFRSIFDQAAVGIIEVRPDGHARLANERFCRMLGYSQTELTGKHFRDVTHPDDLPGDQHQADRLGRGEIDSYTLEKRFLRRDGRPVWTNLTCSAVRDGTGRMRAVVAIVVDVSPQKQAEAKLRRLTETLEQRVNERTAELRQTAWELTRTEQRERQRIAADLHDELAQLLLAARLKLDAAQTTEPAVQSRLDESRDLLAQSMQYVRTLIATLAAATHDDLPLNEALRQEAQRVDKTYGLNVHVHAEAPPRKLSVELRDLLLRAARELLINAAKHAGAAEAELAMWRAGPQLCLQVRDEGAGFDPAQLEQHPSDAGGFGLHHLRRRLRLIGGEVTLRSEPGVGTEVTLHLPLSEQDHQ